MAGRLGLVLALLSLVACVHLPPGARPMVDVPPTYRQWWESVEHCSGQRGDFERVRFYTMPKSFDWQGNRVAGLAYWPGYVVVIAEQHKGNQGIVAHEFLHLIASHRGHTPDYFRGRCRAVVVCAGECLKTPWPDSARVFPGY